jgi:CubicO group peptidase (beta-lactamase class C family)
MKRTILLVLATAFLHGAAETQSLYFPGPDAQWERRHPREVGMDPALLDSAVAFALANESTWAKDPREQLAILFAREPYPGIIGPTKERGSINGIVLRRGYIVAEWGDTRRVDMSFSVAKSFVATLAGLAFDRGMIHDFDDPVKNYVHDGGFDSPHNSKITWRMLLQQTSEWEGTLFGKPDVADRRRGYDRTLNEPGTFWEYNDVRVNRASLSLLRVWQRHLPTVLKELVMDPIGASETWVWHGYENSDVEVNGTLIKSVSGGGHWGGGIWISSRDLARFGLLHLRRGVWEGKRILSEQWIDLATTPCTLNPSYGFLWWLNTGRKQWPAAPEQSFAALGAGDNVLYIDPVNDLVVVVRWIDRPKFNEFLRKVLASIVAQ